MDFARVEHDLYGLPAAAFTAERDARAKAAKADGDKDLSARIKALKRPTAAAVVVNQLVRRHSEEITPLLELGEQLRAATAAGQGAELRTLSARQQTLLRDLGRRAAALATEAGQPMTAATARAVDDSLRAAVADPALGEQLRRGCLAEALGPVDFFGGFGAGGFAPPEPPTAPVVDLRARQLAKATAAADAAAEKLESAREALAKASDAHDEAARREAELEAQLTVATKQREALQEKKNKAERTEQSAAEAAADAAEALRALEAT